MIRWKAEIDQSTQSAELLSQGQFLAILAVTGIQCATGEPADRHVDAGAAVHAEIVIHDDKI